MKAIERVEAWIRGEGPPTPRMVDISEVIALAKEAADLKRRVRLALRLVTSDNGDDVQRGLRLLDLRKPATSATGRQRRRPRGR